MAAWSNGDVWDETKTIGIGQIGAVGDRLDSGNDESTSGVLAAAAPWDEELARNGFKDIQVSKTCPCSAENYCRKAEKDNQRCHVLVKVASNKSLVEQTQLQSRHLTPTTCMLLQQRLSAFITPVNHTSLTKYLSNLDIPLLSEPQVRLFIFDVASGLYFLLRHGLVHKSIQLSMIHIMAGSFLVGGWHDITTTQNYQPVLHETFPEAYYDAPELQQRKKPTSNTSKLDPSKILAYRIGVMAYVLSLGRYPYEQHPTNLSQLRQDQRARFPKFSTPLVTPSAQLVGIFKALLQDVPGNRLDLQGLLQNEAFASRRAVKLSQPLKLVPMNDE